MIYSKESNSRLLIGLSILAFYSCRPKLPEIKATLVSEQTLYDTDDPAIWVNKDNPENSIVFGTDKDEVNGGVYAFDLAGKIINEKSISGLSYPNNVDVGYDFKINDSTFTDILVFTERENHQIRVFTIPEMRPLDRGGLMVFEDEKENALKKPMGIATFKNEFTDKTYVIVSRKEGPLNNYLHQYEILSDPKGIRLNFVRSFGKFSGIKEIEAIAIDSELGFVYYADEDSCIRKYYADPNKGNNELACFGGDYFERDIEGIAIVKFNNNSGYLVVSDQQDHSFVVFDRTTNNYIKRLNLGTKETDGCDVTTASLGSAFPQGLFVSMTDTKAFVYHKFESLDLSLD